MIKTEGWTKEWNGELEQLGVFRSLSIHKRGWIFQEMVLSRRVVHFCEDQMYWQCHSLLESEDGIVGITQLNRDEIYDRLIRVDKGSAGFAQGPLYNLESLSIPSQRLLVWYNWMSEFTLCKFTISGDRFAALAGVTRLYQSLTKDTPVLGMWRTHLPSQLCWSWGSWVEGVDPKMPSWTWLSTGRYHISTGETLMLLLQNPPDWECVVEDVEIKWADQPLVSNSNVATLILRSIILHVIWPQSSYWASLMNRPLNEQSKLLLLWQRSNSDSWTQRGYLVVHATSRKENEYRRSGYIEAHLEQRNTERYPAILYDAVIPQIEDLETIYLI